MRKIAEAAADFLGQTRVAVTGVSRDPANHGANVVYQRFRDRGYEVFAVNPNAEEVEGDPCYPDLSSIPDGVDAVVIGTAPEHAKGTVEECLALGIGHVWFHRGPGAGSVDAEAAEIGRRGGIAVIDGGLPVHVRHHRRRRSQDDASDPQAHRRCPPARVTSDAVVRSIEPRRSSPGGLTPDRRSAE